MPSCHRPGAWIAPGARERRGTTMKRMMLALFVAVAAVGTGVGAALVTAHHRAAPATTPGSASPAPRPASRPMVFLSKATTSRYVDGKPTGLSAGDVLTQHSVWYQHGDNVGQMALTATVTERKTAQTGEVMFTAVASLERGGVVMTGRFDVVPRNQTFQAAVTGGTGQYA